MTGPSSTTRTREPTDKAMEVQSGDDGVNDDEDVDDGGDEVDHR